MVDIAVLWYWNCGQNSIKWCKNRHNLTPLYEQHTNPEEKAGLRQHGWIMSKTGYKWHWFDETLHCVQQLTEIIQSNRQWRSHPPDRPINDSYRERDIKSTSLRKTGIRFRTLSKNATIHNFKNTRIHTHLDTHT